MELIPTKEEGGYSFIDLQKSFKAMVPQLDGANWHLWYSRLRGHLCFIPNGMDYIQDDDLAPVIQALTTLVTLHLAASSGLCKQEGSDNIRSVVLRSYDKTTAHDLIAYLRKELEPKDK